MAKIEVYFKHLTVAGDTSYYHEFIVLTPDKGLPRFIRGGPESDQHFGSGSGGGSAGFAKGNRGADVPFGAIHVTSDIYDEAAKDWSRPGTDPSQVIITGSDQQLQAYWNKMLAGKDTINKENIGYAAAGPNSNTVVTSLLQAAGLPLPKNNGLDGVTPAPGADMSLLGHHYSAGHGYDELAVNARARGMRDVGHDVGAVMREFRKALKAAEAVGSAAVQGMGVFGAAMAVGRPGLGGFAPVADVAGRPVAQKAKIVAPVGEAGSIMAGSGGAQTDAGALAARQGGGGSNTSYRAVLAQARHEAAAGRARREADAAGLHLPARGTVLGRVSFAPPGGGTRAGLSFAPPGGGTVDGDSLYPARPGATGTAGAPVLLRQDGVHDAVPVPARNEKFAAAEAAPGLLAPADIGRALEDYIFRQSRLPPAGGAGFNPLLSPVWAGLKVPG